MKIDLRKIVVQLLMILFFVFLNQIYSNVSETDSITWKTYNAPLSQISFSYPGSWNLIPETPNISGGLFIFLEDKNMLFSIDRWYDTSNSSTGNEITMKNEEERTKVRDDSIFSEKKIIIGNDTCLEIQEIPYGKRKDEEEIYIIKCFPRNYSICQTLYKYTPGQDSAYIPYIKKILSSLKITGRCALTGRVAGDCSGGPIEWRTYKSAEMGISFSYPACWFFEPPQGEDKRIHLQARDSRIEISRLIDTTGSRVYFERMINHNKNLKRNAAEYSEKNILLGNDSCTTIRYKRHTMRGNEDVKEVNMYCLKKRLFVSGHIDKYSPSQDSTYTPIIDKILGSFSITDGGAK